MWCLYNYNKSGATLVRLYNESDYKQCKLDYDLLKAYCTEPQYHWAIQKVPIYGIETEIINF